MTRVAILWHMHQPFYEDLATREHVLPWVRLHALKDYYGMIALLREFPDVRLTFNLVPSLLVQLEAFAQDRARDRHLEVGLKPAAALDERDIDFALDNFFHAQRQRMIDIYPRYAELLAKRGGSLPTAADRRAATLRFTRDDLRDLQVWHKLAWIDPFYLDGDPRVRALVAKGRSFTEDDKQTLREVELELLNKVIPEYRAAAERGQAELSTSPFFHPILPLLCDSDIYLRTHPDARMPRHRFAHVEDAVEQLDRAVRYHTKLFGVRPAGLWPSEGSVSDAMVPLVAAAGFAWMATDELILARTLGATFSRDGQGHIEQPERLYAAYTVSRGDARVSCAFRDHVLSDLIGFTYAGWRAEAAADDFVGRLVEAGERYRRRAGGGDALIPIILDGENAWEHFEGGGRPFLRALYARLSGHPELRTVPMAEACQAPSHELTTIFPGSWIDANFSIWIGHADDQRAWSQLAEARDAIADAPPAAAEAALEEILIAEGSDWFWWYGDDHSSDHDLDFDDLFRRHLRNVYQMLGQPVREELFASNITTGGIPLEAAGPVGLTTPVLDGQPTSYFEWLAAGIVETEVPSGTMTGGERKEPIVCGLLFGFDLEHLYLRIDLSKPANQVLVDGVRVSVSFTTPADRRLVLFKKGQQALASLHHRTGGDRWTEVPGASCRVAVGEILEAAISFADLGLRANNPFAFFVSIQHGSVELERHPAHRPIESLVPTPDFEKLNWKA